jgi:hypothetical protein
VEQTASFKGFAPSLCNAVKKRECAMGRREIARIAFAAMAAILPSAVCAQSPPDPKQELQRQIEAKLPRGWTLRASWRGDTLVAFISLYQPERQLSILRDLCKQITPSAWELAGAGKAIALEPVISGKGATSMRVDCKDLQPTTLTGSP